MYPILFEIGGFPVYTYGLLLAAAYLLGLQFALVRARSRGLDPNRVMDLGIWIIVSALVGAKLMLVVVERDKFGWSWTELVNLFRSGRRLLRRADRRGHCGVLVPVAAQDADLDSDRRVRAGHRARPRHRPAGLPLRGLLLRRADDVPWAITFTNQFAAQNVGTTLGHSAASDAALRGGR